MRNVSQVRSMIRQEFGSMIMTLEAKIVSIVGGRATVKPTARRTFEDNEDSVEYPPIPDVRVISLVWNRGKSGISGQIKEGDDCLLIAISHADNDTPDHKVLSACAAICGFSDVSAQPFPGAAGVSIYSDSAQILLNDKSITMSNGGGAEITMTGNKITMSAGGGLTIKANTNVEGNLSWSGTGEGLGGKLKVQSAEIGGSEYSGHQHDETGGRTSVPIN